MSNPAVESVPGICDVELFRSPDACDGATPALLIEVPHGATTAEHFDGIRRNLRGPLPEDIDQFFFVNTDVGAPECATEVARGVSESVERPITAIVLRCLVPRTFIDCNRIIESARPGPRGLTPGLPEYIDESDADTLKSMHAAYHGVAERAYAEVCGRGGLALMLHTYAPRSIQIDRIDESIVEQLRRAYAPGRFEQWEARPAVDMITQTVDGQTLAPAAVVGKLREAYAAIGVEAAENATYRLHTSTMGHRYSDRYPEQVLCVELNRALLAEPFAPFREMRISAAAVSRLSGPIVHVLAPELDRRFAP